MIAAYLSHLADNGRAAAGIGRAIAGVAWHHPQAGIEPAPTSHEVVKQTMRGVRRSIGAAKRGKEPIVADMLMKMLVHCPDTLAGKRDAALLSLCFSAALRRSELCALEVDDLIRVADGLRIRIKRSKTDQTGEKGHEIAVIRAVRIQPVVRVEA